MAHIKKKKSNPGVSTYDWFLPFVRLDVTHETHLFTSSRPSLQITYPH